MSHQLFTNSAILLIRRAHPYIPIPRPQCARSRRIGSREKGFSHASQISSHQNRALHRHRNRPRLPGRRLHVGFHPVQQVPGNFWLTFMPLILFFMKENQDRKYLLNMWLSFICGLAWGLCRHRRHRSLVARRPGYPRHHHRLSHLRSHRVRTQGSARSHVIERRGMRVSRIRRNTRLPSDIIPHRGRAAAPYELERNRYARHLHLGHSGHVRAFLGMRRSHRKIRHWQAPLPRGRKRARSLN